jgi:proline racemase
MTRHFPLTSEEVKDIVERVHSGVRQQDLAEEYDVARQTISKVYANQIHKHVHGVPRKSDRRCRTCNKLLSGRADRLYCSATCSNRYQQLVARGIPVAALREYLANRRCSYCNEHLGDDIKLGGTLHPGCRKGNNRARNLRRQG